MAEERPVTNARRMSDAEALMWAVESDPVLRSSFLNVTFLDRAPDFDRFRRRIAQAAAQIPRLRQRVVNAPMGLAAPSWVEDPDFDLDFHVRHLAAPAPGTDRQVLDLAAVLAGDAFDPARPLWQYVVVDGLEGGRSALLAKMHHTITDGVGGVRLSAMFIDLERDPPEPEPAPPVYADGEDGAEGGGGPGVLDLVGDAVRRPFELTRKAVVEVVGSARRPVETTRSLARQLIVTDKSRSPLWAGKGSLGRRFDALSFPLDEAKAAARALGGTINDLYVTGVAGGAGAYHRACGAPVDELRMSMPISTRTDRSAGGNSFAPTRVLVPAGVEDPVERFRLTSARLNEVKAERSLGLADTFAGLLTTLPTPLLLRLARQQVETVDFACSNVRGAPFDLYIAGARVLANHPMGPTAGTAFNATLLSYLGSLDVGVNTDTGAVSDPDLLVRCLRESLAEVIAAGT